MIYDDIIEKYCITNLPMGYMPTVAFLVGSGLLEYNAACGFDQFCKKHACILSVCIQSL